MRRMMIGGTTAVQQIFTTVLLYTLAVLVWPYGLLVGTATAVWGDQFLRPQTTQAVGRNFILAALVGIVLAILAWYGLLIMWWLIGKFVGLFLQAITQSTPMFYP